MGNLPEGKTLLPYLCGSIITSFNLLVLIGTEVTCPCDRTDSGRHTQCLEICDLSSVFVTVQEGAYFYNSAQPYFQDLFCAALPIRHIQNAVGS